MLAGGEYLPWELLVTVVSYLNLEDFVNFKATRRHLVRALRKEAICREIVKVHARTLPRRIVHPHCLPDVAQRCIPHAKEASLADRREISYVTAVDRAFERREAFALARPYSVLVLGRGISFVYRDGILCYLRRHTIRVLDVHGAAEREDVIDVRSMGRRVWPRGKLLSHVELLHCQECILSFLYYPASSAGDARGERWLIAIDIGPASPAEDSKKTRVRLAIIIQRPRIWVRNNREYLYVGAHDGVNHDGRHEWVLQGYDLNSGAPKPALPLRNLWGTDLRETVVFEIFDGYLYAVSNRSSCAVEEIDWTSFYHCQRFPVADPSAGSLQGQRIWRRQHREGPINDSWTDLGLHRDEQTGDLFIIEARKEWKDGVSAQKRTFYSERLDSSGFSAPANDTTRSRSGSPAGGGRSPSAIPPWPDLPDHPLTKLVAKGNHPLYADPIPRAHRHYYPEYPGPEPAPNTFMLSRTRYRTFLPASSAFLDVVLDDCPLRPPGSASARPTGQQQIRLRIGSRVRASPLDPTTHLLRPPVITPAGEALPESEERFVDRGILLWPPTGAPRELVELLNPGLGRVGDVSAMEDERSVVYLASPATAVEGAEHDIVLVNFDRGVRHGWLPRMTWPGMDQMTSAADRPVTLPGIKPPPGRTGSCPVSEMSSLEAVMRGDMATEAEKPWWRQERAMHLDIQKGYRFQ
jgi:hypothetical protein